MFFEEAQSHAHRHEQHAIEIVQRLRVYSAHYVEPPRPQDARSDAAKHDSITQTGFLDRPPRLDH